MHNIKVFISHSWAYTGHYETLAKWIFEEKWNVSGVPIAFFDFSIPRDNPIHFAINENDLRNKIFAEIMQSHIVICPTGMYSTHSKWIGKEIDGAQRMSRPILGVNPWGQERKSSVVVGAANKVVGWNAKSVVGGIWELLH